MKLYQLDLHADYSLGAGPLALAVQTLDTLTRSPAVRWEPSQRAAACRLVHDARRLLDADVLNIMASDDTDYAPLAPLPEARTERPQTVHVAALPVGDGYEWKPAK